MAIRIAGRDYMPKEVFIKSEITLVKKLIKWQDIPFVSVEVRVARDAFNICNVCAHKKALNTSGEWIKN